jgi:hypothetical protein
MSRKPSLRVATAFALLLIPAAAEQCRGDDFDDRLLEKVRQRREAEGRELQREVSDALTRSESVAAASPEKTLGELRALLDRLREERTLPQDERKLLIGRVEERLDVLADRFGTKTKSSTSGKPRPTNTATERPQVAGLGGVAAQVTPVVIPGQGFVRVNLSGTFVSPTGFPAVSLNTTVSVPDGGTAVVGGYSSLAEGRHEYGPPGLSNIPYGSRLFKNVGYGRQVRSVRVLVGVRVISLREEDERLLSQGSSK